MRALAVIGSLLGLAVLSACSADSDEAGGEAGAAGAAGAAGEGGASGSSSGSGGVSGTSSNGGSAGVAGASSGSGGGSGCGCVDQELSWGRNGGFVAYADTSTLEPCHAFTLTREQFATDPVTMTCTDPIESCDDIVDPGDIQDAFDHPDVVLAFASSPVLYGRDTRPVDGSVFQIHNGSLLIEIGLECGGAAGCTDAPQGVLELRTLLETLTEQLRARPPCSDAFD
jgi:hypothetical protein